MTEKQSSLLQQAITHLQQGEHANARALILKILRENPANLDAWLWALEVAKNEKEKRSILNKILQLDPTHNGALRYLEKLDQIPIEPPQPPLPGDTSPPPKADLDAEEDTPETEKVSRVGGLIRFFTSWLVTLPASCGIFALILIIISAAFIYFRVNTSLLGLSGDVFDELQISNAYQLINAPDYYWEVQYEGIGDSKYIGIVRHVAPIRIDEFRILTHDILVTTADFANPEIVDTTVIDHKFIWKSPSTSSPNGTINLIHAVPANKEVYQALLEIQNWDTVKLTGREIYTVNAYQADQTFLGTWADAGCNTLLVETVSIIKNPDQ
jgi:hypothetical protein